MNRSSTSGGLHHLSEFEEVGRQFQERLVQFHVLQNIDVLFTAPVEVIMVHVLLISFKWEYLL